MNVATDFDRERSLEAMWHAYRASHLLAQNKVAVEPGVVRDLLNARYYDASRGQFISQDPVFWSKKQNLSDPQSFNTYSYASNNPISKSDPSGLVSQAQQIQILQLQVQVLQSIVSLYQSGAT